MKERFSRSPSFRLTGILKNLVLNTDVSTSQKSATLVVNDYRGEIEVENYILDPWSITLTIPDLSKFKQSEEFSSLVPEKTYDFYVRISLNSKKQIQYSVTYFKETNFNNNGSV